MTEEYDSRIDTVTHIHRVGELLDGVRQEIDRVSLYHDHSKLREPEKAVFDEVTPKLKAMTYGSEEYAASLADMKPALDHHYSYNRHHPEHFGDGVMDMDMIDLLEMLADWKAAGERHADGYIERSLEINEKRFGIPTELMKILRNTVDRLGWLTREDDDA
jgi:hypothetical protein